MMLKVCGAQMETFFVTGEDLIYSITKIFLVLTPRAIGIGGSLWQGMMTSSNENIFRFTGPLCVEFTRHRWIILKKASDVELWYFLWSAPEQMVEQTIEAPVIWVAIALITTSL